MAATDSPLLSVRQAAKALSVTVATIRNMIEDGRLSAARVGHTYVVSLASVDAEFARRYPDYVRKVPPGTDV